MVPEGWSQVELQDLAHVERGKFSARPRNDPKYYGGETPFVQTGDVASANTYLCESSQSLNDLGVAVSKVFPAGSIFITIAANIGETAITTFAAACPDSVVAIRPHPEKADVFWLKMYIETLRDGLDDKATKNAQKNINLQVLKPLRILVPPYVEQQKIAKILSTWDESIATTEQLLANSEQQKKALMQQLLTGKRRLSGFSGDWRKVELGEMLDYRQPTPFLVKSTKYSDDNLTPVLTAGKSFILGYTDENSGIFHDGLPVIIFDDFTTASRFVDFPFKVKSSAIKILNVQPGFSIKYVFEAMQMIRYSVGGHQRHWISIFSNLVVPVPLLEEQEAIASVLSAADSEIESLKKNIERFNSEKKALMQQLLTGKRRVKIDETERASA